MEKFGDKLTPAAEESKNVDVPSLPPATSNKPVESANVNTVGNVDQANAFKDKGNELLKASRFDEAIEAYTSAIACSHTGPSSHIYYANRAAAYSQLCRYEEAAADAGK